MEMPPRRRLSLNSHGADVCGSRAEATESLFLQPIRKDAISNSRRILLFEELTPDGVEGRFIHLGRDLRRSETSMMAEVSFSPALQSDALLGKTVKEYCSHPGFRSATSPIKATLG
jgi:hypothetical protein